MKNKIIRLKKGQSHIEIVLSFVIFIGFVIFIFAIFNPLKETKGKELYLDMVERGVKEQTSIAIDYQSIGLNQTVSGCFCFDQTFIHVIVKNETDDILNATGDGTKVCINGGGTFFYIYSCDEFIENSFSQACLNLDKSNYTLGLYRSYNVISDKKLEEFSNNLTNNYNAMKEELSIPASEDFSISVRDTLGNSIYPSTKNATKGIGVLARDVNVPVEYENGTFKFLIINVQEW